MGHNEGPSPSFANDEVDARVVSVLLETTGKADSESQPIVTGKVGLRIFVHIVVCRKTILT